MVRSGGTFVGDFSDASRELYKVQHFQFRAAYRDTELAIFIFVLSSQGDGAFAINEPGNIGCIGFA